MNSVWSQYSQSTLEFCESLMNGWVRQPANTWSNIGFLIVGIILLKRTAVWHLLNAFVIYCLYRFYENIVTVSADSTTKI